MAQSSKDISTSTYLTNVALRLAKRKDSPLRKYNYEIDIIDLTDDIINPDVVLTSFDYGHSILFECKSQSLKEKQLKNYWDFIQNPQIFLRAFTLVDYGRMDDYYIDVPILTLYSQICNDSRLKKYPLPVLELDQSTSKICLVCNDFQPGHMYQIMHKIFNCMDVPEQILKLHTAHYIDPNDDCRAFVKRLLGEAILTFLLSQVPSEVKTKPAESNEKDIKPIELEPEELAKIMYGDLWGLISPQKQKQIRNKILRVFKRLTHRDNKYLKGIAEFQKGKLIIKADVSTHEAIRKLGTRLEASLDFVINVVCKGRETTIEEFMKR